MEYIGRQYPVHGRDAVDLMLKKRFRRKGDSEEKYLLSRLEQVKRKHQEYIHESFRHTQSKTQSLDHEQFRFLKAFKKADEHSWRGLLTKGFTADPHTLKEVLKTADDAVSGTIKQYLNELCKKIKEGRSCVKHVWAAWKAGNPNDVVFVVEQKDNVDPEPIRFELNKKFPSLRFEIRVSSDVNSEAKEIMYSKECKLKPLTGYDHDRLKKCIARHSARLLKEHSNIQIISPCSVRSKRFGTNLSHIRYETCIVLYVKYKGIIPFGESLFPSNLDGIPVDVREGEFKLLSNPDLENLRMGCQIGAIDNKYGTLGGFVDLPGGKIGALTCAHVLLTDEELTNYAVSNGNSRYNGRPVSSQPASSSRDFVFGTLEKIVLEPGDESTAGVDVALVKITNEDRSPTCGEFDCTEDNRGPWNRLMYCSGNIIKNLSSNIDAREIIKCGSRTGMTKGRLHSHYSLISPRNINHPFLQTMYKQIEITNKSNNRSERFSDRGDSGALVLVANEANRNDLNAIGLLIGGTTYDTTIASPIGDVLSKFNIEKLKTFPLEEDRSADIRSNHTSNFLSRTANLPSSLLRTTLAGIQRDVSGIREEIRLMREELARLYYYFLGG